MKYGLNVRVVGRRVLGGHIHGECAEVISTKNGYVCKLDHESRAGYTDTMDSILSAWNAMVNECNAKDNNEIFWINR